MLATTFFARAAVLLASVSFVHATGNAIVKNQCDFDVYLWSVSSTASSMKTIKSNGGEYAEAYQTNPDGGGISIKVGRDNKGNNITQYEYTLEGEKLWYDLSLINGHPFIEYGVSIIPGDDDCRAVICPAGIELCAAAYMIPTDNWATAMCGSDADTVLVLCSGDEDTNGSGASSVAASAASTASAVTVFSNTGATATATTTKKSTISEAQLTTVKATNTWGHHTTDHSGNNVVVHTTFVTYVVTVEERDAAPTAAPIAKRQMHRHEHGQQKRHEHVHQQ